MLMDRTQVLRGAAVTLATHRRSRGAQFLPLDPQVECSPGDMMGAMVAAWQGMSHGGGHGSWQYGWQ